MSPNEIKLRLAVLEEEARLDLVHLSVVQSRIAEHARQIEADLRWLLERRSALSELNKRLPSALIQLKNQRQAFEDFEQSVHARE